MKSISRCALAQREMLSKKLVVKIRAFWHHCVERNVMSLRIDEPLVGQAVSFTVRAVQQARAKGLELDKTPMEFQRRNNTNLYQPIDLKITRLISVYHYVYYPELSKALREHNPWGNQKTLDLAYDCMKIAYMVDRFVLDELGRFAEMVEQATGERREYAAILQARDSYQFLVLDWCDYIYGMIKQEVVWDEEEGTLSYDRSIEPRHKGAIQDASEELYKDWRERLERAVPDEEAFRRDRRLCQGNY
jgi:hypothetical protein